MVGSDDLDNWGCPRRVKQSFKFPADTRPEAQALSGEDAARLFHETYERLAPSFGYETRPDTKAFDPESPNGKLMIAVCGEVLAALSPTVSGDAAEALGLEWSEDGYSLRTPYDGDVDGEGRHVVVGGETVVTFADSDEGDKAREWFLAALSPTVSEADEADEAVKQLIHGSMSRDFERRYTVSEADGLVERTDSSLVADMLVSAAHQPHTRAFTNAQIVEAFAALEAAALRAQPSNEAEGWRELLREARGKLRDVQGAYATGQYASGLIASIDAALANPASVQAGGEMERLRKALLVARRRFVSWTATATAEGKSALSDKVDAFIADIDAALNPEGSDHAG
jgi:hypothetical protein